MMVRTKVENRTITISVQIIIFNTNQVIGIYVVRYICNGQPF